MIPFADFPDIVADVEIDPGLTWDFKLPEGVTLTGTPTITVQVYRYSKAQDSAPQSRLGAVQIGTAENSTTDCAVLARFGPGEPNVTYVFIVSCDRSDGGKAGCFNKITAAWPP